MLHPLATWTIPGDPAEVEAQVREFARTFETPQTDRMLRLAETGAITWEQAYGIACTALARAQAETV